VRGIGRFLTGTSIAIIGVLHFAGATGADCSGPPPGFAETIASAQQIVIGDIVAVHSGNDDGMGRSMSFTLLVSDVVRGPKVQRLEIDNVATGGCPGNIVAAAGDRIALALNATAFDPPVAANGVAWIAGPAADGFETVTVEVVYKLAGVRMPEPGAAAQAPDVTSVWLGPAVWGFAVAVLLVAVGIIGRRIVAAR
jgi:hypothetical protein